MPKEKISPETGSTTTYESAFAELQQIVRDLQDETTGIDELSVKIARATELIRFCRERLRATAEKIEKLAGQ